MERPYYLYVRLVEILEQDAIIQKVIVNVMQLHHIGLYLHYLAHQSFGSTNRATSLHIQ